MSITEIDDDFEVEDETLVERLWGLTEMFPQSIRNLTSSTIENSVGLSQTLFSWSKTGLWVLGSSFTVLVLPIICENERSAVEEQQAAQQRQILLGPSATVASSGAPNLIPGMAPGK